MLWPAAGDDTYGVNLPPFGLFLLAGAFASMGAMVLQKVPSAPETARSASFEASTQLAEPSEPMEPGAATVTKPSPGEAVVEVASTGPGAGASEAAVADSDAVTIAPALAAPTAAERVGVLPSAVGVEQALQPIPAFEQGLFGRMNAARAETGQAALVRDEDLDGVALARARNLVELGYFDHYAPDGTSAFSELAVQGLPYYVAGENLARNNYPPAQTVDAAFHGLMASEGHRANILEPRFGAVGVAAVRDGNVWLYVTVFTNPR